MHGDAKVIQLYRHQIAFLDGLAVNAAPAKLPQGNGGSAKRKRLHESLAKVGGCGRVLRVQTLET